MEQKKGFFNSLDVDASDILIFCLIVGTIILAIWGSQELATMFGSGGLGAMNRKEKTKKELDDARGNTDETVNAIQQSRTEEEHRRVMEDEQVRDSYDAGRARVEEMADDEDALLDLARRLYSDVRGGGDQKG